MTEVYKNALNATPKYTTTNSGGWMISWNVRDILFGPNR